MYVARASETCQFESIGNRNQGTEAMLPEMKDGSLYVMMKHAFRYGKLVGCNCSFPSHPYIRRTAGMRMYSGLSTIKCTRKCPAIEHVTTTKRRVEAHMYVAYVCTEQLAPQRVFSIFIA